MNWSELIKRRANLLLLITTFFISCESPKNIGLDHPNPNGSIGVFFEDSFDLQPKTVLLDSMPTSGSYTMLVGEHSDPVFGDIKANAFMDLSPSLLVDSSKITLTGTNQVFQSLTLNLALNYTYGVDLSQTDDPQTIEVYELKDTIDRSRSYTNADIVEYDATRLLGTVTFKPKELLDTKAGALGVEITDTDYQQRIFNAALGRATVDEFTNQVKGLAIVYKSGSSSVVIGFNRTLSSLNMAYLAEVDQVINNQIYSVFFANSSNSNYPAFNQIQSTNKQGVLRALSNTTTEVEGTPTLHTQAGTGVVARIDLVDVLKLKQKGEVSINKAELVFSPLLETVNSKAHPIPSHLILIQANGNNYNKLSNGLFDLWINEEVPNLDNFGRHLSVYNSVFKHYTYNITQQLQQVLNGSQGTQLFVVPSALTNDNDITGAIGGGSVTRLMIDNQASSNRKIQLKVFYTIVKQ
ncbi:DUF4270 family protein [uncultured Microscilla sp.]|uniref:DUF4270 family protein n=1 Tax=uncultured Microscilla sp. TaxID=432653 RepID=UPI00262CE9C6|nr:DUF4270 family protein [uncultured Microscilla sp.]